jgi:hypothetical protein
MTENRKVVVKDAPEIAEEVQADYAAVVEMDEPVQQEESVGIEDIPDDELVWPNGPTAGQIKAWKKEHGDVYVTSISYDKHIAWRTLTRLEYKNLFKKMEQLMQAGQLTQSEANLWNEEAIAEVCILYPSYDKQSLISEMAGLPSLISQEVLEASGFLALEVRQL